MRIVCPLCQSHQSERLALTYAQGVSHSISHSVGVGVGGGGGMGLGSLLFGLFLPLSIPFFALKFLGIGLFGFRTKTHTSTLLAAESKPPKRLSYLEAFFLGVAYVIATLFFCAWLLSITAHGLYPNRALITHQEAYTGWAIAGFVWIVLVIGGLYVGIRGALYFNNVIWAQREAGWQRSFLCKRCGAHFLIADYDPIGVNVVRSDKAGTGEYLPRAETPDQRAAVTAKAQSDHKTLRKKL